MTAWAWRAPGLWKHHNPSAHHYHPSMKHPREKRGKSLAETGNPHRASIPLASVKMTQLIKGHTSTPSGGYLRSSPRLVEFCVLQVKSSVNLIIKAIWYRGSLLFFAAAICLVLWQADGKPPQALYLGITLNTALAFLTSLAKVAFPHRGGAGSAQVDAFSSPSWPTADSY